MKRLCVLCVSILLVAASGVVSYENATTFKEMVDMRVKKRWKTPISHPMMYRCIPKRWRTNRKFEAEIMGALVRKFPEFNTGDVVRVLFDSDHWNVSRDEFTGFIRNRYLFAHLIVPAERSGEYYIVWLDFYQRNRFLGYLYHEPQFRKLLGVDRIKKEHLDVTCTY